MIEYILSQWVSLLISILSLLMVWLMGNKSIWGPLVGLISQVVWVVFTIQTAQWGLLPGVIAFIFVHGRNLYLWGIKK